MDTKTTEHVYGSLVASTGPPNGVDTSSARKLGVYGCGIPTGECSTTNSSTADSVNNSNASSEDGALPNGQRRSPYSSDSSDSDIHVLPPKATVEPKRQNMGYIRKASAPQPRSSSDTLMASSASSAANVSSKSKVYNNNNKSSNGNESRREHADASARLAAQSSCADSKSSQHQAQKRLCSFYSEPVPWRQDSGSRRCSQEQRSPAIDATDAAHLLASSSAPSHRKEMSIAVQGSSGAGGGGGGGGSGGGRAAKDEKLAPGKGTRPVGAHLRRTHGQTQGAANSDRLPLHRIMNDPRVYYVVAFAGLATLGVISAAGIALAARRRRRRRRHNMLGNGLSTARSMATAMLTACAAYIRWVRRLMS